MQPQDDPDTIGTMQPVTPGTTPAPVQTATPVTQPTQMPSTDNAPQMGQTPTMGTMHVTQGQLGQSSPQAGGSLIDQALRIEAQSTIANADAAFEKAQYARAEGLYFTAQQYSQYLNADQMQHITNRLAESRLQLGDRGGSILDQQIQNRGAQADRARSVVTNLIEQSQMQLDTGLTELSQTNAEGARSELNRNQDVLSASEFQSFRDQIDTLLSGISQRTLEQTETDARDQERHALIAAESKEVDRVRKKELRLREALDRVRALQQERRYREALAVVNQDILFIDPRHLA